MSQLAVGHKKYRSIPNKVLLYISWRNLTSKKLRSGLTLLGIVIGVGAIYFLLSFGIGLRDIVTKEVLGSQSVRAVDVSTPNSQILKLNNDTTQKINQLPHIQELSTSFTYPGSLVYSNSETEGIVYGIDTAYQDMTSLNLSQGRLLNKNDVNTIVINVSTLKAIGVTNQKSIIGKTLQLRVPLANSGAKQKSIQKNFTVVGVIDSGAGSEVFIPKFNFEAAGVPVYSSVKLLADNTKNLPNLRKQIESLGFQTTSPIDTVDQINQIFKFFNLILLGFGMIGMIVAVLGMFNTLTISLLERTKEIGLMIALGSRPKDMRKLFIFEAVLLSIIGAIIGIFAASALGMVINILMNIFARSRGVTDRFDLFVDPIWLIFGMIGFMVLVGLLVVYFPARRAQRINPIDALRRE